MITGIYEKNGKLTSFIRHRLFDFILLNPVHLPHQPLYPVPVNRLFESFAAYGKSRL